MDRGVVSLIVAAALLPLAGCGGDKDGTPDGRLGREALSSHADAICRDYTAKVEKLERPAGGDVGAMARYFASAAGLAERQQSELRELHAAGDVARDWRVFLARDREGARALRTLADSAKGRATNAGARELRAITTLDRRIDAAAHRLGAEACGAGA